MKNNILNKVSRLRREEGGKSLLAFARLYLSDHLIYPPSAAHHEIYELLYSSLHERGKRIAIALPRGFGKTTLVALIYVIYCVCYQKERFIEIFSNTSSQAVQMLENIKKEFLNNQELIMDFPELLRLTGKLKLRFQKDSITVGKTKILALGAGQKARGRIFGADRPTLIIVDDFENPENTMTRESREKMKNIFEKSILPSGSEISNIIFLGNLYHPSSLLGEYISKDSNRSWIKCAYSAIVTPPKHMADLWMEWSDIYNNKKEFEEVTGPDGALLYYEKFKIDMDEGAQLLWKERHKLYDLMVKWAENEYVFLSEMQNLPLDPRESIFDIDVFHYYNGTYKSVDELLRSLGEGLQIIAACDPSTGKGKDRSAIIILATSNRKPKTYYIIEADIEVRPIHELIDDILAYHARYNFSDVVIEANNFQQALIELLEAKAAEQGSRLPITPVYNTTDKNQRIQLLYAWIKNGTIQFSRNHKALLEECRYFPKGHDDGLDALEMAIRVTRKYSVNVFEEYQKERERQKKERMNKPDSQRKATGIIDEEGNGYRLDDIGWLFDDYEDDIPMLEDATRGKIKRF